MDIFNLQARIGLDTSEYDEGLERSEGKISKLGGLIKGGLATAAKVGVAAIGAASAAVGALVKSSVESYAEYEQLVGGVETLFKDSADAVMGYASTAYKTAGMSANEYMETVTSFSASLLQSLGGDTAKAAEVADMAITDMSDNANKMGTDMEMIQNAYNGFAKANFTMLDNLKLGYGGTKEEMQRLLDDATKLSGVEYDINSFNDIAQAIHVIQTELDITGTTAKEASSTISGSLASAKSAWENLVVGISDDSANFDVLIDNFVESVSTAAGNIIPRVEVALKGVAKLVNKLLPQVIKEIPNILSTVVPELLTAAGSMITAIVQGFTDNFDQIVESVTQIAEFVVNTLVDNLPKFLELAMQIIMTLADGLISSLPTLVPVAVETILQLCEMLTAPNNLAALLEAALMIIQALAEGIMNSLPVLLEKGNVIITQLANAIIKVIPKLLQVAVQIIAMIAGGIIANLGKILDVGANIVFKLIEGICSIYVNLKAAVLQGVDTIRNGFSEGIAAAASWGRDLIDNFIGGIKAKWGALKDTVSSMAQTVKDFIGFSEPKEGPLSNFHTYAPDMMELFAQGIKDNEKLITGQFETSLSNMLVPVKTSGKGSQVASGTANYYITVEAGTIGNDYDAYRAAEKISQSLQSLKIRQTRAVGGVTW
jgi:phage-related protein